MTFRVAPSLDGGGDKIYFIGNQKKKKKQNTEPQTNSPKSRQNEIYGIYDLHTWTSLKFLEYCFYFANTGMQMQLQTLARTETSC